MKRFADLFAAIDRTTSTNAKVDAMAAYFRSAPPEDAAWAVFFLTGRRLKRLVSHMAIRDWTLAATGLPSWMLDECYAVAGDGAETAALIFDQAADPKAPSIAHDDDLPLSVWVHDRILPLRQLEPITQQTRVTGWLRALDRWQRFILLKLLTGELRLGVSHTLVVRALAHSADLPPTTIAARLMGDWEPSADWYRNLRASGETDVDRSRPYPFYLASPIDDAAAAKLETLLGEPSAWLIEWKWDGIRAQLVKRGGGIHLWSRGEELITDRFPDVVSGAAGLPDAVLDGEILAFDFREDRPLPFSALQHRIGRQRQLARTVRDVPVVFIAFDLLEHEGIDLRSQPLTSRREALERTLRSVATAPARTEPPRPALTMREPLLPFGEDSRESEPDGAVSPAAADRRLRASPVVTIASWDDLARLRQESRTKGVEGLMLKRRESTYGVGRKRGDWWKWKIDPFTIDAVLIYAQPGSGKRASLLTDYTFGVWDNGELVPFAKAYSGLTNEEIAELDRWIRRHTVQRFGPVRHVEPIHVFELGFEAIARSTRHRSGIAVRFPRMLRWRRDKPAAEADTLEDVKRLLRE